MAEKRKPKRNRPLQIRVTDEQMELFRGAADKARRSLSDWARLHLEDAAERELKERD